MTAKKNVIKNLRLEVARLEEKLQNQKVVIRRFQRKLEKTKRDHFFDLEYLARDAERIRGVFQKEIAWQELSQHPNTQLKELRHVVRNMRDDVDRKNGYFMEKHMDDRCVAHFHKEKMKRG